MQNVVAVLGVITLLMLGSACTKNNLRQILGSAVANAADTEVRYSALQCNQ